jgi:hypothetical protein
MSVICDRFVLVERIKMELWNCDNGCDFLGGPGDFFQLSSPDGSKLMLVCGSCVYDRQLSEWAVDFESDPRDTIYTLSDERSALTFYNGVITKHPANKQPA